MQQFLFKFFNLNGFLTHSEMDVANKFILSCYFFCPAYETGLKIVLF